MEQLLNIKSVPIKVQVNVTRAKLVPAEPTPSATPMNDGGKLKIKADSIQMNINLPDKQQPQVQAPAQSTTSNSDTFSHSDNSADVFSFTYQGVAKFVQNSGDNKHIHNSQYQAQSASRTIEQVLQSIPKTNKDVSYSDGTLKVNYFADESSFNWDEVNAPGFEFVPGSIEFIVQEMPDVDIEYTGSPIYFPRSADPNYEPLIDMNV